MDETTRTIGTGTRLAFERGMRSSAPALHALALVLLTGCSVQESDGGSADSTEGASSSDSNSESESKTSAIRHLVVIVQENHTFDNYFGRYCSARPGSNPTCTEGPACCEAGP